VESRVVSDLHWFRTIQDLERSPEWDRVREGLAIQHRERLQRAAIYVRAQSWLAFCQQWIVIALCASPFADLLTESQRRPG
jgi:hypothetical protein